MVFLLFYEANNLGFLGTFFGCYLLVYIGHTHPKLLDRVSIRFLTALSAADILKHLAIFCQYRESFSENVCALAGFFNLYSATLCTCITFIMTYVMQVNFLNFKKIEVKQEKFLWYIILGLPLLYTLPLFVSNVFGKNENGACFLNAQHRHFKIVNFINLIIPNLITFGYCLFIIISVVTKTMKNDKLIDKFLELHDMRNPEYKPILQKKLRNWILRLTMYPISYCIMTSGILVDLFMKFAFAYPVLYVSRWAIFASSMLGLLIGFSLYWDPFFRNAFKHTFFHIYKPKKNKPSPTDVASDSEGPLPENSHTKYELEDPLDDDDAGDLIREVMKYC